MILSVVPACHSYRKGFINNCRGGVAKDEALFGENGTVTGKACPKGLYGILCKVQGKCVPVFLLYHIGG